MTASIAPTPTMHLRHVVCQLNGHGPLLLGVQQFWEWKDGPELLTGNSLVRGEWRNLPVHAPEKKPS